MERIYVKLTHDSIQKAIKDVEKYKKSLANKTEEYIERLTEAGIQVVNAQLSTISPLYKGDDIDVKRGQIQQTDNGYSATIYLSGSQAVFIEFGAGITFNTGAGGSLHPKGKELGLTIGSYNPESPNATNPSGWWYTDKWGESQHTYGTPTFAPLYHSSIEMIERASEIAKEVFGG